MTALTRVGLLVLLLAVSHAQAVHASFSIFWRLAVLSWDSPASQQLDDLACQSAPCTDTAADTLGRTRLAATTPTGAITVPGGPLRGDAALCSGPSRAPPTA